MEDYKKMNPVAWFEIYVNDMPRAKKFYEEVFHYNISEADMAQIFADEANKNSKPLF